MNTKMNPRFPQKARDFLASRATVRISRRSLLHGVALAAAAAAA
jgi:hypothetical protein